MFDFPLYFVIYALCDEYLGILHYLPSTGHNDSMAVGYVLVNVIPGMEIEAFNKIKGMKHVDDITCLLYTSPSPRD